MEIDQKKLEKQGIFSDVSGAAKIILMATVSVLVCYYFISYLPKQQEVRMRKMCLEEAGGKFDTAYGHCLNVNGLPMKP